MDLSQIKQQFSENLPKVKDEQSLTALEVEFLGRKGLLTEVLRSLSEMSVVEKKRMGVEANELKEFMNQELGIKKQELETQKWQNITETERQDINNPLQLTTHSLQLTKGHLHPLSNFIFKVERVFEEMGFEIVEGYDIETDYYNFTAVRMFESHPSRDDHDTFYIKELASSERNDLLLRTQTTAMQVRYMEKHQPPIKIIVPGKTFRREADSSHSPMFHQFECLVVDKSLTMGNLKWILSQSTKKLLGEDIDIRFRTSYFPFVEPGLEIDITCTICKGSGCAVCKNSGWVELIGAGMVHPDVLKNSGIDPEIYSGFAFAMGIDRLVMMKYKIPNIKMFYDNDLRFLDQF